MTKYNICINGINYSEEEFNNLHNDKSKKEILEFELMSDDLPNLEDLIEDGSIKADVKRSENVIKNGNQTIYQYGEKNINIDKASGFRIGD